MNIILIGMSGAGKSTLGVLLAKALGMGFVDTDLVIQQNEGRLLQTIIDQDGRDGFLRIEAKILTTLEVANCVIATGGSAVYSAAAMQRLRSQGPVVYLQVAYPEIARRLQNIKDRGIVMKSGENLLALYAERIPLYEQYCDQIINCSGREIEACVQDVLKAVQPII